MTLFVQPAGPGVPNYSQADAPGYGVYAQPYSASEEKLAAKTFAMDVLVDARRFAAWREATLRWAFDMRPPVSGKPWGYVFNFFGNHDGAIVPGAFKPTPFDALKRCDVAWNADLRTASGDAAVLNDTFLYDPKTGAKAMELGVFGHPSAAALAWATNPKNKVAGWIILEGVTWTVYLSGTYVMIIPPTPQPRVSVNLLAVRDWLKAKGLLPPGLLFQSTAVGVEPAFGAGSCRIDLTVNAG